MTDTGKAGKEKKIINYSSETKKKFYRKLEERTDGGLRTSVTPTMEDMTEYWSAIWSDPTEHNSQAEWIERERLRCHEVLDMGEEDVTMEEFKAVVNRLHNWKTPGIDKVHNYFLKRFTSAHPRMLSFVNKFISEPDEMPEFLTTGITVMLPKTVEPNDPAKFRPITCLPNFYKIVTACIAEKIYKHTETNNILNTEQKGCRRGAMGCKEQLVIDSVIMHQAYSAKRNIFTLYIDYQKAFDSVPHSWLKEILNIYKISPNIVNFMKTTMERWRSHLSVDGFMSNETIRIRRGIFQGDALSPLWFCLAANPLSTMLNTCKGFEIKHQGVKQAEITHLMYMDDIKLYAGREQHLRSLLKITEQFSKDTAMRFGLQKCKTQHIRQGKQEVRNMDLDEGNVIEGMASHEVYKYLGYEQSRLMEHSLIKNSLRDKFRQRLMQICKTGLNSRNLFTALNTRAIPVLTYSFGVIKWNNTEIDDLERIVRTVLSKFCHQHPKSAIERVHLPRACGGRGLVSLKKLHCNQINSIRKYFHESTESSSLHGAIVLADDGYTPLNLGRRRLETQTVDDTKLLEAWRRKPLHGRFPAELDSPYVDKRLSHEWLVCGSLFPETEGFMLAIQDQVINTRSYAKHILNDSGVDSDLCRRCSDAKETIHHIIAGCQVIAQTDYKNRHDKVAKIIHQKIAKQHALITEEQPYYKYTPAKILEGEGLMLYWDRTLLTDRTIGANRPDITLVDRRSKSAVLIDVAVPNTNNLKNTYNEKVNKYRELAQEVKALWRLDKVTILPIVISATGVVPVSLLGALEQLNMTVKELRQIQKAVILSTCNITRSFLNIK